MRKLWAYFVSEVADAPQPWVDRIAGIYYSSGYNMRAVVHAILSSPEFWDPSVVFARYSWPVEFVVRAIKETGWAGYSVDSALNPMLNMGQSLFEPPDVNGWDLGQGWFSTGAMLNRMNYAASLTTNQRINLRNEARPFAQTPQGVMSFVMERLSPATLEPQSYDELLAYLRAGTNWTASDNELRAKVAGVMHLVLGSSYYQLVVRSLCDRRLPTPSRAMAFTRREFVKGGVAAFTWGFAAPAFLSDVAHAQGAASRNLVVLYLGGGNDSLNTRRPLQRRVLLLAPADDRHPAGIGAADRQRRREQRARPAPEPGRPAQHLQPGPAWRSSSAPAIRT